ncbi:class I SAM-dependent methyltransferase [Mycolicibacterium sp. 018/SC-01/001]|uniref:class I SAM-dependent methyltransferase n=1 Tax=Mycolicibacterium sp. 018/SC-01/001 TaxID=2592069 RepID=UPI00117CE620|nr:class I SAM-dependent methyltransferase [Mycolicibacterium sp. 018/SC-01/001]TRW81223.1 class I SAM-dependent methyltransferase [Mycolicibacterium sp. 018/SC-01/001]
MDQTPALSTFDAFYRNQTPPWVIDEPQPAVIALAEAGHISGRVLDVGCGTGEHTIYLTRAGYDVLGVDGAPTAVDIARRNAAQRGVAARFAVGDAFELDAFELDAIEGGAQGYDTVLDSALFHVFDDADRVRYVRSLGRVTRPGGVVLVLALSDAGRGFGPQVTAHELHDAFDAGWTVQDLTATTYRGVVTEIHAEALGLAIGARVDEPAHLLRVRRD